MNKLYKINKWFWGIMFLLIAAVVLVNSTFVFFNIGIWKLVITLLLLSAIVNSIPHRQFFGILIPGAILYKMYAPKLLWFMPFSSWSLIWAAVFASIGLTLLFGRKSYRHYEQEEHYYE